jgi:hypothetical protein
VKIDVDTLKQVSPTNPHVSKVTPQVSGIANGVLQMKLQLLKVSKVQSLECEVSEVQALELQVSKNLRIQDLKPQISDIKTLEVQVLNVHISDIELSKVQIFEYPSFGYTSSHYISQGNGYHPCFGGPNY